MPYLPLSDLVGAAARAVGMPSSYT